MITSWSQAHLRLQLSPEAELELYSGCYKERMYRHDEQGAGTEFS